MDSLLARVRAVCQVRAAVALALLFLACALPARAGAPAPATPRKVLLIGDSHIVSGLGPPLERLLSQDGTLTVIRQGKTSSGLARPDFFDWQAEARRLVERHRPDIVVLMMGGNDGQDLIGGGLATRVRWHSPAWADEYRGRVRALMEALEVSGRQVLWLELPQVASPHLERKVERIRQLQREALSAIPNARYIATHALLRTPEGTPLRTVPGPRGRPAALRMSDGVHLTAAGGHYFATQLLPLLRPPPLPLGEGRGEGAAPTSSSL